MLYSESEPNTIENEDHRVKTDGGDSSADQSDCLNTA